MLISSTTETRESRGEGVITELKSMGPGVGIGTLKARTENQRAVYATRRGVKTSMLISRGGREETVAGERNRT